VGRILQRFAGACPGDVRERQASLSMKDSSCVRFITTILLEINGCNTQTSILEDMICNIFQRDFMLSMVIGMVKGLSMAC
jgi:hypothetical protein